MLRGIPILEQPAGEELRRQLDGTARRRALGKSRRVGKTEQHGGDRRQRSVIAPERASHRRQPALFAGEIDLQAVERPQLGFNFVAWPDFPASRRRSAKQRRRADVEAVRAATHAVRAETKEMDDRKRVQTASPKLNLKMRNENTTRTFGQGFA